MLFLWLVLLQVIIITVLVLFMRLLFTRHVSSATAHLHELNEDYSQKLDDAKKRQTDADKYYDDMLVKAKTDAERSKVQILKEARDMQTQILTDARRQSEEILTQGNAARQEMIKDIDRRVDERAMERACELVQTLLPEQMTLQMHEQWVDELLKNGLGELSRLNLPADVHQAHVASAHALDAERKAALGKKIKDALKREIKLEVATDPKLVAGIRITLGSVIIDGSLRLKIKEAAKDVADHAHDG